MSHGGIQFVGNWPTGERRLVERTVAATDEYLGAHMPGPWVFEKGDGGYSVTQSSLFEVKQTRLKLGNLLERIRGAAADAAPWVTYSD